MKKVTVGIIGAGRIGKLHIDNLRKNPYVRLKKVSDLFTDQLMDWFETSGVEEMTKDYDDIFQDQEIDAVFICSPTSTHADLIKRAAQHNKHIFCEKPVSFSDEETLEAYEEVRKAGVHFQVGFNRRFDNNFSELKARVERRDIGDVHVLKITSRDPNPPHLDYITSSGGLFMDMTIHDFDMARHLVGEEVVEVYAKGGNLVDPAIGQKGDIDTAIVTLTFANGALGVIDNSREAVYGYDQRIEIFGNGGALVADNQTSTNLKYYHSGTVESDKPLPFFLERYNESFIHETEQFIASILQDRPTGVQFEDGIMAQRIARAAQESYETGKPVQVNYEIGRSYV
ncbi:inositol 2-dehydrogenase [Halobacillus litoralis]|uniref:Inositol 2-dehydrogenase n=1 Tax=Halobacillus litoralis TaxID=45668 RepID=A0A845DZ54_9BACI|nr:MULTISPECIES: inositol 2-dehydrogenase [Halobacillus]MYL21602.1 inositol 2-dehydrogenase [Halobacillus litoralis]MYL29946.1 inositol 2-dehydrogenase [Halobacillus halophilus]